MNHERPKTASPSSGPVPVELVDGRDVAPRGPSDGHAVSVSRDKAVTRLSRGLGTIYVGLASMGGVVVADIAGLGGVAMQVGQFVSALLIWVGCIVMISGVPHLARFGNRSSALALSSFAGAGVSGLLAVAEMFESSFLESSLLEGLDSWALGIALVLLVCGTVLLRMGSGSDLRTDADSVTTEEES